MPTRLATALRLTAMLASLAASPVIAQSLPASNSLPDDLQSYAGDWELQQEDASAPTCPLTFTDQQVQGGWAITLPDACPAPFPNASAMAVWSVDPSDSSITVSDSAGHPTMKLLADPDGFYATDEDTTPRFYLVTPQDPNDAGGETDAD